MSENSEKFYKQPWFIFLVAALAVVLIVVFFVGHKMVSEELTLAEALGLKEAKLDYLEDNLDKYLEIDREDYAGYEIKVDITKPGERELENKILSLLAENRGKLLYDGMYQHDKPLSAGDKAYIRFAAYTLDENGKRNELGITNYDAAKPLEYIVGSNNEITLGMDENSPSFVFPIGFDLGLVGKSPLDCTEFEASSKGNVRDSDIVYATATFVYENGIVHADEKIRIDLRDPDYESVWGAGVYEIIIKEKTIGMTNDTALSLDLIGSDDRITYTSFTVDYVTRCEDKVITLETQLPYDYEDEKLANETVYFDVFIDETLCYETAEFDEDFIKNTLKINEKKLEGFSGDTLVEKCRAYYLNELMLEYEDNYKFLAIDKMWEYLNSKIEVKKYPRKEIKRVFADYVYMYNLGYAEANSAGAGYESVDEYIAVVELGMEEGTNWDPVLNEKVEAEVKEKMIFYYILREENFVPTDEEFAEYYRRELELDYKFYTGKTALDFETSEEYEAALKNHEDMMVDYYGSESYYSDEVLYLFASEKMLSLATVINEADQK